MYSRPIFEKCRILVKEFDIRHIAEEGHTAAEAWSLIDEWPFQDRPSTDVAHFTAPHIHLITSKSNIGSTKYGRLVARSNCAHTHTRATAHSISIVAQTLMQAPTLPFLYVGYKSILKKTRRAIEVNAILLTTRRAHVAPYQFFFQPSSASSIGVIVRGFVLTTNKVCAHDSIT